MRKVQFIAVFWTLFLAVPFTVLAISMLALWTSNLTEVSTILANLDNAISVGGRGIITQFSERWPEVAGMIIGQLVIMTILLFARRKELAENHKSKYHSIKGENNPMVKFPETLIVCEAAVARVYVPTPI